MSGEKNRFRIIGFLAVLAAVCPSVAARAQSSTPSYVPNAAFFIGLGGSYNSVNFSSQNVYAQGVSNVYSNGQQIAYGAAGGSVDASSGTQGTFAPAVQLGYFQHFAGSGWLWGGKFLFSYLGTESTSQSLIVPQAGSFTSSNSDTFTGNVVARSYEMSVSSQVALIPFIGRSFTNGYIYVGGGPTLSHTQYKLNGVIGFADINGTHADITGTPSSFSSSQWVPGGIFTVGGTYFLAPSWFIDGSYSYALTGIHTSDYSGPFASATDGYTDTGILSGTYSGRVISQALTVSLNKEF